MIYIEYSLIYHTFEHIHLDYLLIQIFDHFYLLLLFHRIECNDKAHPLF